MQFLNKGTLKITMVIFDVKTTIITEIVDRTIVEETTVVEITITATGVETTGISMAYEETSHVTTAEVQIMSLVIVGHLRIL